MNYLILIFFGLAPSVIWLLYFLRKDVHPEDNRQVIKIFIYGLLVAIPTAFIQWGIFDSLGRFGLSFIKDQYLIESLFLFLVVAPTEELFKYLVVQGKILSNSALDEPIDLPLYLIISALGFAASENLLVLWQLSLDQTLLVSGFRFVSATFLHALTSGVLGVFLALGYFKQKYRYRLFSAGFFIAIFLHGIYNFSIMMVAGQMKFLAPVLVLISLALLLSLGLAKLKKIKSVCEIK